MDQTVETESSSQVLRVLRQRAKDGTLKGVWRDWKWIWSFSRGRWGSIALYIFFGIASSGIGLVSAIISKYLIDCIVAMDLGKLLPLAGAMVGVAVFSVAFKSLTARFSARLGVNMLGDVRRKVFRELLRSEWMEITGFSSGDLLNRLSGDVSTVASCAVSWLPNVIIQLFTLLGSLAVVLYYDPVMALIAFASTPVLFVVSRSLLRRQRDYSKKMRQVTSGMFAFQSETFRNIDTLKSFGVEKDIGKKLDRWQENYRDVTMEYNDFSIRTNMLLSALGTAVEYLAMAYCLWRLWRGDILFGTMVLFLQQRSSLSSAFSSLVSQIPTALSGSVAAERLRELTQLKKEKMSGPEKPVPQGGCRLELRNVRAAYTKDREVLLDVNITADSGEVIALVGPSGEGKSTLMRLMLGLVRPEEGRLYLEDWAGNIYPLGADTRHLFAYVPQGNTVLAGTIAENLRLVNPDVTEEEMVSALKDACAWEFVSQMPGGVYAGIGEGGKGLSEGQAQRIAIARALVRNAPVMLLDEITSALDMETEQRVLNNLMRRGVTCVAATHRPSVLNLCSRVYRVHDGRVEQLNDDEIRSLMTMGT